jgi:hypothetical protein
MMSAAPLDSSVHAMHARVQESLSRQGMMQPLCGDAANLSAHPKKICIKMAFGAFI